jgi:hypothetical protein
VTIPFSLDFAQDEAGSILDDANLGTGFTMVLEHSEARRPGDLAISNPNINGYEPSLLTLNTGTGQLAILSQAGIAFLDPPASTNNNNQVNTLGVGLQNIGNKKIRIKSSLIGLTTGLNSAQAGIWFGFDEDNFVKLNVNNNNQLELRVERAGASVNSNTDQLAITNLAGLPGGNVILEMEIDPITYVVQAFYTINGGTRTLLATTANSLILPANYFTGRNISGIGNVTFAGIFATHRNGTQFTATFDDFAIEVINRAPTLANAIDDQTALQDQAFSFEVPAGTFNDPDTYPNASLSLTATLSGGGALPTWLSFDGSTFSGTPTNADIGTISIEVTANDGAATISDVFTLTVNAANQPPVFTAATYNFTIDDNAAILAEVGTVLANDDGLIQALAYSITAGNTGGLFAIGAANGIIVVDQSLTAGTYTLMVEVSDGALTDQATVGIVVNEFVPDPWEAHINFQNIGTNPPSGYGKDYGREYGNTNSFITINSQNYAYGWKNKADNQPIDVSDNDNTANNAGAGRNRLGAGYDGATVQNKLEGTLVHFQGDNILSNTGATQSWAGQPRGNELYWEIAIPSGTYQVTVSLGDKDINNLDSRHSATVEGYTIVPAFVPSPGETRNATIIVSVTDGFLTVGGLGGYNSKINYIDIVESTGTPVSGALAFSPAQISAELAAGATGNIASVLSDGGAGAGTIGLVIDDNPSDPKTKPDLCREYGYAFDPKRGRTRCDPAGLRAAGPLYQRTIRCGSCSGNGVDLWFAQWQLFCAHLYGQRFYGYLYGGHTRF